MNYAPLLNEIARILMLPADELTPEFVLSSSDKWDSMGRVELLVFIDSEYQSLVKVEEMRACRTIGDIYTLIEQRQ